MSRSRPEQPATWWNGRWRKSRPRSRRTSRRRGSWCRPGTTPIATIRSRRSRYRAATTRAWPRSYGTSPRVRHASRSSWKAATISARCGRRSRQRSVRSPAPTPTSKSRPMVVRAAGRWRARRPRTRAERLELPARREPLLHNLLALFHVVHVFLVRELAAARVLQHGDAGELVGLGPPVDVGQHVEPAEDDAVPVDHAPVERVLPTRVHERRHARHDPLADRVRSAERAPLVLNVDAVVGEQVGVRVPLLRVVQLALPPERRFDLFARKRHGDVRRSAESAVAAAGRRTARSGG